MSGEDRCWGRYTDLRPAQLAAIRQEHALAYIPWGSLEWHGPHLPFGTDGMIAANVGEQLVQRTGGVLLPTMWLSGRVLAHPDTLGLHRDTLRQIWRDTFASLATSGWKMIITISGHYAPALDIALMEAAEQAMRQHTILVLALAPLMLIDDALQDRAALWETSLMLSIRPELVDIYALGNDELNPESSAVRGRDPRGAASPSLGDTVVHLAVESLHKAITDLATNQNPTQLYALYAQRRDQYRRMIGQRDTPDNGTRAPTGSAALSSD